MENAAIINTVELMVFSDMVSATVKMDISGSLAHVNLVELTKLLMELFASV